MSQQPPRPGWQRGLALADLPDLARLMAEIERHDDTGEHYSESDLVEELDDPALDPAQETCGVWLDERLVAYWWLTPRAPVDGSLRVYLAGGVAPDRRGLGLGSALFPQMVERACAVARDRGARTADLLLNAKLDAADIIDLATRHGFEVFRYTFAMRAGLDGLSSEVPELPEGLALRTYTPGDAEPWRLAHNEAFVDHPGFTPWDESMWVQWVTGTRNFRPSHSWLCLDGERIASYVHTMEFDAVQAATGRREAYIAKVGTLPSYRGRGLGTTLLRHTLAGLRADGYDEASLEVDTHNPAGALRIYERAGFEVERRFVSLRLLVDVA